MKNSHFGNYFLLSQLLLLSVALGRPVSTEKKRILSPQPVQFQLQFPQLSTAAQPTSSASAPLVRNSLLSAEPPPARFRFAPSVGIQNNVLGYGGLAELFFSTGVPFYIGVESGYLQFDGEMASGAGRGKMMMVPILLTLLYRFDLARGAVHPYLGAGVGASLSVGKLLGEGTISDDGTTNTDFMLLGKPGVEFEISRVTSFFMEPQFGIFQKQFVFLPQIGFAFSF